MHTTHSPCPSTVIQMISAVTQSLFRKHGVRETEHAILANLLSPNIGSLGYNFLYHTGFLVGHMVKNPPAMHENQV